MSPQSIFKHSNCLCGSSLSGVTFYPKNYPKKPEYAGKAICSHCKKDVTERILEKHKDNGEN